MPASLSSRLAVLALGLGALSGCADDTPTAPAGSLAPALVGAATDPAEVCKVFGFSPNNFSNSTRIDNQWLPLVPGTRLILEGQADRGSGARPHRVVFTVTDLTKVINGVRTVVIWDRDIAEGQIAESELAFFAQDDHGNVWNLGEYPEEFEDGKFTGAPSTWIAGLARAKAGIHMRGKPRLNQPRYLQGFAPDIEFLDCAKVIKEVPKICVPFKCFEHVLLTDETSPLDPEGGHQRKFHAPGVGIAKITPVDDPEGETLVLVKIVHLNPHDLREVSQRALGLERRAYRVSEVYRHTAPAEHTLPAGRSQ
jgi:hypothetical protein